MGSDLSYSLTYRSLGISHSPQNPQSFLTLPRNWSSFTVVGKSLRNPSIAVQIRLKRLQMLKKSRDVILVCHWAYSGIIASATPEAERTTARIAAFPERRSCVHGCHNNAIRCLDLNSTGHFSCHEGTWTKSENYMYFAGTPVKDILTFESIARDQIIPVNSCSLVLALFTLRKLNPAQQREQHCQQIFTTQHKI